MVVEGQHVRCPDCGRYQCLGQFSLLQIKCEKCKLRFQVTNAEGSLVFRKLPPFERK